MDEHDNHEDGDNEDDDKDDDYDLSNTKEDSHDDDDDDSPIYTDITDPTNTDSSSSSSPTSTSTTTDKRPGGINTQGGTNIHDLDTNSINSLQPETKVIEQTTGNEVLIMNANDDDRTASFFAQPGILAAVIGGAVVGLLCAILVVMFIVYRMRKKDEGSYALDEPKRSPAMNSYAKNATNREFYA
uniref:Syndecan n=3 Tax=Stomoxys calcitrans TaxID=35570 RepID=A0A1I8NRA9_STOCA